MSKPSTARADLLRALREHKYGHLQAKVDTAEDKAERLEQLRRAAEQKMRPYAGKQSKGIEPDAREGPRAEARKARDKTKAEERKATRQRLKFKRRTALPQEGEL